MKDVVEPDVVRPYESAERIAGAQARRDQARLAAAQAEIAALRTRLARFEHSPSRRALRPATRFLRRVIRGVRRRLGAPAGLPLPPPALARGFVLVIDDNWPQPDRDAGSVEIVNLLRALAALGHEAILAATKQHEGDQPARDRLEAEGIRCLRPDDAPSVKDFIIEQGSLIALCFLCRVFCGGAFLETVYEHARQARVVFNPIDLNFLREERKAHLLSDPELLAVIRDLRRREEHIIRSADATMVVSAAEQALLAETMPDCLVAMMPLARAVRPSATPFAARRGIGFIGGFAHGPNSDAVRYFLAEIWPLIYPRLPDCTFSIVGADAPADLLDNAAGPVRLLGHVPDVDPWFESLRLTVAPLRYGAGAKGKVASSLAAGVPCVATEIAAEGMSLGDEGGVLVAADPVQFAAAVCRAYQDEPLWNRLSAAGSAYATHSLSLAGWQGRLEDMLKRIGF
jgi:glycosyltransferase involved in cell wall biosynthesis